MFPRPSLAGLLPTATLIAGASGVLTTPGAAQGPVPVLVPVPSDATSATVFLVGDAGVINDERTRLLEHLGRAADSIQRAAPDRPTATVFLGDNIYDEGIRPDHRAEDIGILVEQVTLGGLGGAMPTYFISGNHDWGDGGDGNEGLDRVEAQRIALDSLGAAAGRVARLLPAPGCPGPETVDLGRSLRLIFVDTEWMIRRAESCGENPRATLLGALTRELGSARDRPALILAHHPLETGGPHGGGGSLIDQIWKWLSRGRQDLGSSRYDEMVDDLIDAVGISDHDRVMIASGHEHSLQVIDVEEDGVEFVQIVSGSGAKLSSVDDRDGTRFAAKRRGYVKLDVDGPSVRVTAFGLEDGEVRELWTGSLFPATPPPSAGS
ncbi:MAG: hypothetical protein KJO11_02555 [Gemmatimonadetes bacterium]|nr:hypothetical protein [Gemmatimonadota bacterium]